MQKFLVSLQPFIFLIFTNQSFSQVIVATQGDINFLKTNPTEVVTNLYCQSSLSYGNKLLIQNSVANDTILVYDQNYAYPDTFINVLGTTPFLINLGWGSLSVSYQQIPLGETYFFTSGIYTKAIAHGDTLHLTNLYVDSNIPITDPSCSYEEVSGEFYIDNNLDCQYNTGDDDVISSIVVNSNYTNGQSTTYQNVSANGQFQNLMFKSDGFLDAIFSIPSIYNFAYNIPACAQIMYSINSLPATGINFARECAADIDLRTYANGVWPGARPLIPFNLYPKVDNIGCQAISGVLELILDPNVTYDAANSSNPADYTSGNSLFWNYSNLTNVGTANSGFWNQFVGGISLTPNASVNIGDILTFTVQTSIPSNDVNPSNNSYTLTIPIVNSYDPNVKHVEPKGIGTEGFIPATTEKLTYTVDFQNTGNADAINVYILDTLEGNVIPQSLKIVSTSHQMNPQWLTNNVLKFNFPQIHLPDSTTNEAESHGFVTFEIDMVQGLTEGTEIENTAYIYFDANPAIITNTAKNTIEFNNSISELQQLSNGLALTVYPNPMTESTTFKVLTNETIDLYIELYDMTGKMVVNELSNSSSQITINKKNLENGVYIYKIVDLITNESWNGRIIVQ